MPAFGFLVAAGSVAAAALSAAVRWRHQFGPPIEPPAVQSDCDGEPHSLVWLGAEGRPNPLHTEVFPDYPAALVRQRELGRLGQASVVRHVATGQVRIDIGTIFGAYSRIRF
ncbi:MAG: hypothetical protein ACM33T_12450 [Solirubrobacterales bacterium]